jgi:hypothetical protein
MPTPEDAVLRQQTQVASYWTTAFTVTRADIEFIFSQFLEAETPLTTRDLALRLIGYRLQQEEDRLRKQIERGLIFQPKLSYEIGQEVVFPALNYSVGKVVGQRPGENPDYGEFTVIEVEFDGAQRREFASELRTSHILNLDEAGTQALPTLQERNPEAIFTQYGEEIIEKLEARLVDEDDAIYMAGYWYLESLLAEVNVGHLHLAEAVLDISEGGPLPTKELLEQIDFAKEAPDLVREFSLNVGLNADDRFDNVGPEGQVLWFLRRLEPQEVSKVPPRLLYQPVDYDASVLTEELRALEREIDDEYTEFDRPQRVIDEGSLTLIYPHRRVGTLPLTSQVAPLFPVSDETPHVRVTLMDGQTGDEFAGWVVPGERYVFGLSEFYRTHRLPIGAYVTVRTTPDPSRLIIDFQAHRARTEYIRLAVPKEGKLTFANFKRSIGASYDELMILGAEDIEGVDAAWQQTRDRRRNLTDIMRDLMPELSKLNPQNAVHAKTLYSAVNVLRRCPPGPIFAALVTRPEFQHVGGPYWRLAQG